MLGAAPAWISFRRLVRALQRHRPGRAFLLRDTLLAALRGDAALDGLPRLDLGLRDEDYDPALVPFLGTSGFALVGQRGKLGEDLCLEFFDSRTPVTLSFVRREGERVRLNGEQPAATLVAMEVDGLTVLRPDPLEAHLGPGWRNRALPPAPVPDETLPRHRGVVYADGSFDLLHPNHVAFLEASRALGDYLVVGVISDENVRGYKRLPVMRQEDRLRMVSSLATVDEAFLLDAPLVAATLEKIILTYRCSKVVYSGGGWEDYYAPAERRGLMVRPSYLAGHNTTAVIRSIFARDDLRALAEGRS